MTSTNVETLKRGHDHFNAHRYEDAASLFAEDAVYYDRARDVKFRGREEILQFWQGWHSAFSDARVSDTQYSDAGDVVIAEFTGRGTNDGPLGSFPPSHREIAMSFCEVVRFDHEGKIASAHAYYDSLSLLSQLGHIQPPGEMDRPAASP